ncbi:four-helix bundle copper-binding protein [Tautonia plasticadhaerens]|uniref:Four-helix bundle copper-binding protein n=1 Tax=Tautonia plasticadhaerens TaxID=2527974 RepID=A0A518GW77_9BACT|nr:four-helix bundle copper-binding protein [Tautonia plasticadhaerens]QDV32842.1 hypothetical protein ElP_06820 [Tautonia plasticadhaerens]
MQRRDLLSTLGLGAAALTVTGRSALAGSQAQGDVHAHDEGVSVMEVCAKYCNEAALHCLTQLSKGEGDAAYHAQAHEITVACQEFCHLSAQLMARHSSLAGVAHEANAKACDACAEVCEKSDEAIMKECAEQCRKCAEHCRSLATDGHQHG